MDWANCLKNRIAKEIGIDLELIESLKKTSRNKLLSMEKLSLDNSTAASKISLAYDSLREILEALAVKRGYKIYNHECYTYFLKEVLNELAKGDEFDELRKTRNNINYYGKEISIKEAKEILEKIKKLREEILERHFKDKRVFIIHGWDFNPEMNWYPWLKKILEDKGFIVEVPEMPNTSEPKIDAWLAHLKKVIGKLDNETYFIAHSIGCQAVMRFLEKESYNGKIGKAIFVAGWFKLDNLEDKEVKAIANPWLNTQINFTKVKEKLNNLNVFLSSNEPYGNIKENEKIFKEKLGAKVTILKDKGHFTEDDGVTELPEIVGEMDLE